MTTVQAFEKFRDIEKKIGVYTYAMSTVYYDSVTAAPPASSAYRGEVLGALSETEYELRTGDDAKETVAFLLANKQELSPEQIREIEVFNRDNEYTSSIPKNEYIEYTMLINDAESVWHKAKAENDFAAFCPYLEKIVDCNRRFARCYKPDKEPYDVLLDRYEPGLDVKQADAFFGTLREHIVPLLKKVTAAKQPDDSFLRKNYPAELQKKLSLDAMRMLSVDMTRCALGETEHPFTMELYTDDVRITTHFYENDIASALYSTVHESGHALYELGIDKKYDKTSLTAGVSMGIHECISRFFENIIGRSSTFAGLVFPKLEKLFPEQLKSVTADDFRRAVNKAQPSLIRTEADELTYSLHIMVRYELEKDLIAGTLRVADLPQAWNAKYKQYLGIDVPDDKRGVLQDSHWSGGSIGYFPSYALGSAYGAQIFAKMNEDFDVYAAVASDDISKIEEWLRQRIFRFGKLYDPKELFERCVGAPFDPTFFTDYLEKKFTELYDL